MTAAAISAVAARLETGGFAYREVDPHDRRRVLMQASPAGSRQAFSLFDDFYQAIIDLLGTEEVDDVRKLTVLLGQFRGILIEHATAIRAKPGK